ncbi:MAG: PAS domain S-box protein, partial [Bacteroidota bacterium]|nr:PAS domain S-box protein [Bacteroidota bacterium]
SKDEVLGKNWFEIFIPEKEKNKITEIFIKTLKKMQSKSINENIILTKNKEERIIDWSNSVVRNSDNEIYGVLSIGKDITDQKKAEKALFENELNFRNIFNESNDGIIITSLKGKIIDINDRLCKMLEYEKEELLHKQVSVVRPKESRLNRDKIIERLKTKGRFVFESVNKAKSGEEIPVEISSIFIEYFGEKAILSATRDITERKQAEQKLLTAIIKTEEKERQRVAQDLHDGLGPLISTIKLYVQWAMKPNKKADKTDLLKKAEENISEAYKSLRDISNNLSPHILQNFGLISALNSYADRVKETSDIEINIDANFSKSSANIVDTVIYRVFTESVNNTIKHAEATRIDIILNKTEDIIKAEYFDNGTGFDVDSVLKSKKGQGLYNTQNRLKSIGGKLQIKSRKGEGTLIEIEIDLSKLKQLN